MITVGLGIATALNVFDIVDAVNERLPDNERFDLLSFHFGKRVRLHREYRRLFPTGKLLRRQGILGACMLACVLSASILLGIPLAGVIALAGFAGFLLWHAYLRKSE
jgi:hypothetical protein